jgi:hypothetical protein
MAIPFLNNISLSNNELQNAKLHIIDTPPPTNAGQIYFDSTSGITTAKYYDGSVWINLVDHAFNNSTYINLTETGLDATRALTADLSAIDGVAGVGERYLTKNNTWAEVAGIPGTYTFNVTADGGTPQTINSGDILDIAGGTYITTSAGATDTVTINHDSTTRSDTASSSSPGYNGTFNVVDSITSNSTGHITGVNLKTVAMPYLPEFFIEADGGTPSIIDFADTLLILGGTNINTYISAPDTIEIRLDDSISLAGALAVYGTGQSFFGGQVTVPITPSATTDAASKNYVDNAVAGGLIYQGGFDGSTGFVAGTSDYLDNRTGSNQIAVNRGWTYTVTVAGTFYGENVEVGDVLIAEDTLASGTGTLADWTTVQNNIDLASALQVGIGNVAAGTGISVSYNGAGTATITNTDTNASNTTTGTITAGNTSGTVTHNWGTLNTIVQTIDSSGDTVFCDISRTTNTVVATIADTQAGDITILVQKIG